MRNDTQHNNTQRPQLGSLCCVLTQNMPLLLSVSIMTLSITILNAEICVTTLNIYSRYIMCCVKRLFIVILNVGVLKYTQNMLSPKTLSIIILKKQRKSAVFFCNAECHDAECTQNILLLFFNLIH